MANISPVTPGFYAGLDVRVFIGSWAAGTPPTVSWQEYPATKVQVDADCPMSDRTNSMTGGEQAGTRTTKSVNGSISFVCPDDATGDPNFEEGNTYPVVLITHDARGYYFYAYFETVSTSTEAKGDLGYDVKLKSNHVQGISITHWNGSDLPSTLRTALGITAQAGASGTV